MDIRRALHEMLRAQHAGEPDTLILDELGLCQGVSRVDVAVINGAITGYEIKSEHDTLARLPIQAEVYNRTLDYVGIVVDRRHLDQVVQIVPEWWSLYEARLEDGKVVIYTHRTGRENPGVDPMSVVQLLWRDEVMAALKERELDKGMLNKPRRALWSKLVANVDADELKAVVRNALKSRKGWRVAEARTSGDAKSLPVAT